MQIFSILFQIIFQTFFLQKQVVSLLGQFQPGCIIYFFKIIDQVSYRKIADDIPVPQGSNSTGVAKQVLNHRYLSRPATYEFSPEVTIYSFIFLLSFTKFILSSFPAKCSRECARTFLFTLP